MVNPLGFLLIVIDKKGSDSLCKLIKEKTLEFLTPPSIENCIQKINITPIH